MYMAAQQRWAELAPELLAHVVRLVQSRRDEEQGEARRVVAMAGVCSWWRQHILSVIQEQQQEHGRSLIQFPWELLHPPRKKQEHVQCLLKRKGSLFLLFQAQGSAQNQDQEEVREGKDQFFLLAARRRWRPVGFSYQIGLNPKEVSSSKRVLGKLKSNFWASQFVLWHCASATTPVVSLRFLEHVVNGIRQRRIWCALPPPPCTTGRGLDCVVERRKQNDVCRGGCVPLSSCISIPLVGTAKGTVTSTGGTVVTNSSTTASSSVELRSKIPAWDAQQQCWSLDFKGRATMPSMHNFQLVLSQEQERGSSSIILQLGKIDKNSYTMDFCYPLSVFQAFAISLSSFATSAGLEP